MTAQNREAEGVMPHWVVEWIGRYGAPAIFGLLILGIVGLPVPDESLLTLAGVLISRGRLRFVPTYCAAALGSMVGITLSYVLGRSVGVAVLTRYGRALHLPPETVARVEAWFARRGKWMLTVGYFLPGVRHVTAVVAGASRLRLPAFALCAYLGAVIWSATFLLLGWYAGHQWRAVEAAVDRHLIVASGVVLGVAGLALIRSRRRPR